MALPAKRKPPVFQCAVGHSVCLPCRDKLVATGRGQHCHVCIVEITGGHQRNIALENLLESIRVPCVNAAHGCAATPAHYDHRDHVRACPHKPCYCPAGACGFAGSTAALLHHFAAAHGWPCTTETRAWMAVKLNLRDGFNAVSVRVSGQQYLFLLNVARNPFGRAISVFCVHPHQTAWFEISLKYSRSNNAPGGAGACRGHCQETKFNVGCTDLSGGPPHLEESYQFFLPNYVHPEFIRTIVATFDVIDVTVNKRRSLLKKKLARLSLVTVESNID